MLDQLIWAIEAHWAFQTAAQWEQTWCSTQVKPFLGPSSCLLGVESSQKQSQVKHGSFTSQWWAIRSLANLQSSTSKMRFAARIFRCYLLKMYFKTTSLSESYFEVTQASQLVSRDIGCWCGVSWILFTRFRTYPFFILKPTNRDPQGATTKSCCSFLEHGVRIIVICYGRLSLWTLQLAANRSQIAKQLKTVQHNGSTTRFAGSCPGWKCPQNSWKQCNTIEICRQEMPRLIFHLALVAMNDTSSHLFFLFLSPKNYSARQNQCVENHGWLQDLVAVPQNTEPCIIIRTAITLNRSKCPMWPHNPYTSKTRVGSFRKT